MHRSYVFLELTYRYDGFISDLHYAIYSLDHFAGLVQERQNSIANALELSLFCTNLSIYTT